MDVRLQDAWTWRHAKKGAYTCSSGYYWPLQPNRDWNVNCKMNWLWRLKVPAKLQQFLCLCFHNVLPINVCRHHYNMVASPSHTCCSSPIEDILHCLRDCPHSKELWLRLNMGRYRNLFSTIDVENWLQEMTKGTSPILFVAEVWYAWCWRNNVIFEDQH